MNKLIRCLCLLLALSLLPGRLDAAAPTTNLTISSLYGLNFGTVTVSDVTNPGNLQPYTCDFSKSSQCVIPNVTRGDALHLALKANNGFIVSGSTGNCAGFPSDTTQFKVPVSGEMACGIFGGYPLTIQAAGAARLGISDIATGGKAIPVGPSCQPGGEASCQVAVAPGTLTLTVGLQQGQVLAGGSGLCSKATAAPFEITVPPAGPYFCAINTGVPSTPASGWWWTQQTPDSRNPLRPAVQRRPEFPLRRRIDLPGRRQSRLVCHQREQHRQREQQRQGEQHGPRQLDLCGHGQRIRRRRRVDRRSGEQFRAASDDLRRCRADLPGGWPRDAELVGARRRADGRQDPDALPDRLHGASGPRLCAGDRLLRSGTGGRRLLFCRNAGQRRRQSPRLYRRLFLWQGRAGDLERQRYLGHSSCHPLSGGDETGGLEGEDKPPQSQRRGTDRGGKAEAAQANGGLPHRRPIHPVDGCGRSGEQYGQCSGEQHGATGGPGAGHPCAARPSPGRAQRLRSAYRE